MIEDLKTNAQTWEQALHTSGGKLELPKCFWFLMIWIWVGGLPRLATIKQKPGNLELIQTESKNNKKIKIKRMEVTEANRVLGVRMSVDGNWKTEVRHWMGQSRAFASKIRQAKFPRICGIRVFPFMWVAKVRYSASIVGYTREQCNKIQSPVVRECLAASGLNSNFPRGVVFTSVRYGGLGWEHMRTTQTYEFINLFLKHIKMNDEMSKLIRISLEKAQQQAGVSSPILERSTVIKPYVDNNWIYCLHKLLMEGSMTIKLENTEESETTRVGDVYLK